MYLSIHVHQIPRSGYRTLDKNKTYVYYVYAAYNIHIYIYKTLQIIRSLKYIFNARCFNYIGNNTTIILLWVSF